MLMDILFMEAEFGGVWVSVYVCVCVWVSVCACVRVHVFFLLWEIVKKSINVPKMTYVYMQNQHMGWYLGHRV